ncbi:unnamed protein product [Rodentolepis nana]|uniref:BTB domain-containing protein n=1 Tax=Rodentolepis nana TaxID=102285 RepID=A0A0R3TVF1_RODNA|nr:unnamed protein product [Rodentolepis nana]
MVFNVSGLIFETYVTTLERFPNTLLGNPNLLSRYYDEKHGYYFFDRHRESFESILYYYQSNGFIQRPFGVSLAVFLDEVRFFRLGDAAFRAVLKDEGLTALDDIKLPKNKVRRKMWLFLEYPLSSCYAKWFSFTSIAIILLSVASFCLETLPAFITYQVDMSGPIPVFTPSKFYFKDEFFYLELVCMLWFTLEIFLRLFSCPNRLAFFKSALNIFDIISVVPFYIQLIMMLCESPFTPSTMYMRFFRFLRLLRVVRILKLSRHSKGLQVLAKTIMTSGRELTLLLFFLFVCVVLFATMVYYMELDSKPNTFTSIPDSFWWAVVTMTTVGYGDMYPQSVMGKAVGCLCAIAGVLAVALPVPVIVSNFNYFYTKERENEELIQYSILNNQNLLENNSSLEANIDPFERISKFDDKLSSMVERDTLYGKGFGNWKSRNHDHLYLNEGHFVPRKHNG